jgi:hypothetical protein
LDLFVVNYYLGYLRSDHDLLKALHMVLYASVGQKTQRKAAIRKFNGCADVRILL